MKSRDDPLRQRRANGLRASTALLLAIVAPACSGERQGLSVKALVPTASARTSSSPQLPESTHLDDVPTDNGDSACNEQQAQEFLQRAHLNHAPKSRAESREMLKLRALATDYRTAQYGYFEGFGKRADNPKTPAEQSRSTTFFGLPVVMHEKVIPALKCVEEQLLRHCPEFGYKPQNLSGLRKKNTYVDGEVSNHVYGIAIDIDPLRNPCCKCLQPWSSSARCRGKKTVWARMAMPRCWVETFERYGFYWLGHDVLEDTMHFEFLGDPERILKSPPSVSSRLARKEPVESSGRTSDSNAAR